MIERVRRVIWFVGIFMKGFKFRFLMLFFKEVIYIVFEIYGQD